MAGAAVVFICGRVTSQPPAPPPDWPNSRRRAAFPVSPNDSAGTKVLHHHFMPSYTSDRPDPNTENSPSTRAEINVRPFPTPEEVRPFEKAEPRKSMEAGKRKRVSAIVTDTPVKKVLEEEQKGAKEKKAKALERKLKSLFQKESRNNGRMKLTKSTAIGLKRKKKPMEDDDDEDDDEEDEDSLCLRCLKPFSNSQPGAQWIQCTNCKCWAHQTCMRNEIRGLFYECYNCADPLDVDSD
ncbi:uncharacterized protein LOC126412150 [Schistocerca serialis cubense]|uniref:uncharacterized protein LOC126412150 n=1 Tax=Schistocerca serialis cubense TaxID=2023355 RepID=UPI00214F540F|nr:uncharacterized protein LOC126412150 [Schistocerca serialis cubense]